MKLEEQFLELRNRIIDPQLTSAEAVKAFYTDWMTLVWNWKAPTFLFDFYAPKLHQWRENGNDRYDIREIVKEVAMLEAAFPDITVRVEDIVVSGNEEDGWQLFARRYFNGTSLGPSPFGTTGTGKKLEGDTCLSLDMMRLEKVNGRWQVVNENVMYSERTFRTTMGGPFDK